VAWGALPLLDMSEAGLGSADCAPCHLGASHAVVCRYGPTKGPQFDKESDLDFW
jgi:hypothetical protein